MRRYKLTDQSPASGWQNNTKYSSYRALLSSCFVELHLNILNILNMQIHYEIPVLSTKEFARAENGGNGDGNGLHEESSWRIPL